MIETERLKIIALDYEQLNLLINNIEKLETQLNCKYEATPIEGFFKEILKEQLKITQKDKTNYIWHSFWLIIRKSDNIVVGMIDFKDIPNEYGEVEIGYGLGKKFEKQGYMAETVKELSNWVLNNNYAKSIIAETDIDGIASQNILQKCGFKKYKQGETAWWRLQQI